MKVLMFLMAFAVVASSPPVHAQAPELTECEKAQILIGEYNAIVCNLFVQVLGKEAEVQDARNRFQSAVLNRQNLAQRITGLLNIAEFQGLTPEQADELAGLLLQQTPMDNAITAADAAVKKAQAELDDLKYRMDLMARLMNEKRLWYIENCVAPPNPNPQPQPDPMFN